MKRCWNFKLNSLITLCLLLSLNAFSQLEGDLINKKSYYLFPIKPGVRNSLAGTMGELRSSHFHTGLDIRTEGTTGLPVYAAAEGYIYRIAISTSGYGNAIYILHPNGQTTVYAHLEKFNGPLADFVREEQYKQQKFEVNLFFDKGKFNVSQGEIIAYSGNSGSSGGPHLHFDIRDANQRPLNPLSYGFDEILDHTPPVAENLIVKTLNGNSRIENQFGQMEYPLRRIGNNYVIDKPITAFGTIGLQLYAYDKLDNSRFRCGISMITMSVNGVTKFEQTINSFSFDEQREILRHMSYENMLSTGDKYHKLYIDDGNKLDFYKTDNQKGVISIKPLENIDVKIIMVDSYGNNSHLSFKIKGIVPKPVITGKNNLVDEFEIFDNTLAIKQSAKNMVLNGVSLIPDYKINNDNIYLFDLRNDLPQVLNIDNTFKKFDFKAEIPSNVAYTYYDNDLNIYFPKEALFDTLYFESKHIMDSLKNIEIFNVCKENVPLRKSIKITLKPFGKYDQKKNHIYQTDDNGNLYFKEGEWETDRISFWTRNFGDYTILPDTIAPTITPYVINKNILKFKIKDERSGLKEFSCFVNDQWVLMNYDYKLNLIWSEKLDSNKLFEGTVKVMVLDNAGNKNEFSTQIN